MGVAMDGGARQPGPVDEAGVIQRIGEHRVALPRQCGHDADVGGIAGVEVQSARKTDEGSEFAFERVVGRAVATDERRGARADAEPRGGVARGLHERGMPGEPEVVVAAEGDHGPAVDDHLHAALARHDDAPSAPQVRFIERAEAGVEIVEPGGGHAHGAVERDVGGAMRHVGEQRGVEPLAQEGHVVVRGFHGRVDAVGDPAGQRQAARGDRLGGEQRMVQAAQAQADDEHDRQAHGLRQVARP